MPDGGIHLVEQPRIGGHQRHQLAARAHAVVQVAHRLDVIGHVLENVQTEH
jgi:hypothetical protein